MIKDSSPNKMSYSFVIIPIKIYRIFFSPLIGPACRFNPSCSLYCEEAINRFGLLRGFYLSVLRVLRCNPFSSSGFDPVPDVFPPLFERNF
jgi:uncharacterized protein